MTPSASLAQSATPIFESGMLMTRAAVLFEDVLEGGDLGDKIGQTAELLEASARLEEEAFETLSTAV